MQIVDSALVLANSDIDLYLLRFMLARALEDTWSVVETSVIINRYYQQQYRALKAAPVEQQQHQLPVLQTRSKSLAKNLARFRYPTPELQKRAEKIHNELLKISRSSN